MGRGPLSPSGRTRPKFAHSGVRLVANVKPAMLLGHPRFAEVEGFHGFIRDREDESRPHIAQFWGGEAAYLDFTNPQTSGLVGSPGEGAASRQRHRFNLERQ